MLRKLFGRLGSRSTQRLPPPIDERKIIAEMLCRELIACGVCERGLSSPHRFAKVASVIVGSEQPGVVHLADAIAHRDWQLVTGFNVWSGDRDNLVVYVISCPDGGGTLAQIYDPVELNESPHIYRRETLTDEELQVLVRFVPAASWNLL
jgi:hypothetical protein